MPEIVIIIKDGAIQTIRPVTSIDTETRAAEAIIDRIAPAIEMMKVLLQDEAGSVQDAGSKAAEGAAL